MRKGRMSETKCATIPRTLDSRAAKPCTETTRARAHNLPRHAADVRPLIHAIALLEVRGYIFVVLSTRSIFRNCDQHDGLLRTAAAAFRVGRAFRA